VGKVLYYFQKRFFQIANPNWDVYQSQWKRLQKLEHMRDDVGPSSLMEIPSRNVRTLSNFII
jgi:hypothetical protein